jgi:hypothetical protein
MFTALRRLTILFVMVEEFFLLRITPSMRVVATVGVMFIGAAIAAWKDLTYDPVSYFYLFLTNLFTSLYTVRARTWRACDPARAARSSHVRSAPLPNRCTSTR